MWKCVSLFPGFELFEALINMMFVSEFREMISVWVNGGKVVNGVCRGCKFNSQ